LVCFALVLTEYERQLPLILVLPELDGWLLHPDTLPDGLHYPVPLHLQQAYRHLGHTRGAFPRAEESAATVLSLPMHQSLTRAQVEQVAQACREILVPVLA